MRIKRLPKRPGGERKQHVVYMDAELAELATARAIRRNMSFSRYVAELVEADLATKKKEEQRDREER